MASDPELRMHQEWIGFVQPVGLVVSPTALLAAQAHVNRNIAPKQQVLLSLARKAKLATGEDEQREEQSVIPSFPQFCSQFLEWEPSDLVGYQEGSELPETLQVALVEYGETLKPTYGVPDPDQAGKWLLLIDILDAGTDFDAAQKES